MWRTGITKIITFLRPPPENAHTYAYDRDHTTGYTTDADVSL